MTKAQRPWWWASRTSAGRQGGRGRRRKTDFVNCKYRAEIASWEWWSSFLTASPSDTPPLARSFVLNLPQHGYQLETKYSYVGATGTFSFKPYITHLFRFYSVAVINTLTKRNLGRQGSILSFHSSSLRGVREGAQGSSLKTKAKEQCSLQVHSASRSYCALILSKITCGRNGPADSGVSSPA